jgi:long-chain acyl-CoA synthetase
MAAVGTVGELRGLMGGDAGEVFSAGGAQEGVPVEARVDAAERATLDDVYPRWPWSWGAQAVRVVFVEAVMRPVVWLLGAPKVSRAEAEVGSGPLLIVANHVTAYDGALVLYALPRRVRDRVAVAMSGEMLRDLRHGRNQGSAWLNLVAPVGYWLLTGLFNVFPLPRLQGFRRSFAHAGEAMDAGYSVMIFPEGTRSKDGHMHAFRLGIGLLAQMSRVGVLPVGLVGLGELRQTKGRWFRSGRLGVKVGPVMPFDETEEAEELTRQYEDAVRRLLEG